MTDEQIKAVINQISGLAGLDPHYRFAVNMAREVLALREALRDVCAAAVGVKTDPFPYAYPACAACGAPEDDDGEPRHLPDCPVAAARALLASD